MVFDDGILKVYSVQDISEKGDKPKFEYSYLNSHYFSYSTVGITRHYTAKANNEIIENVVKIYQDRSIKTDDVIEIENNFYKVLLIQHTVDENGIKISIISLSRYEEFSKKNKTY